MGINRLQSNSISEQLHGAHDHRSTMQLLGWVATRTAEALVDRVADRAARRVKARVRKHVSEKRQLLSRRADR